MGRARRRPAEVVLVTGATSGFGAAIARRFALAGASIVAVGRRVERLAELQRSLGGRCLALTLDVRDEAAVDRAVAQLPKRFRDVTVLVNNAGVARGSDVAHKANLADWRATIETNIGGAINFTRALLPGMVKRDYGHIVNIGSIAGSWPYPTGNVYGATKAFLRQFTLNLRADLLGSNVRATCVEPGTSRTEFAAVRLGSTKAAEKFYSQPNLLEAEDVAEIVYFCTALPRRVNVNAIEVMPISQAFAFPAFAIDMPVLAEPGEQSTTGRGSRRRLRRDSRR